MPEHVPVIRVYCIPRGRRFDELAILASKSRLFVTIPMIPANMPDRDHISVPTNNLWFHPINELSNPIHQSNTERWSFEIALQVPNHATGDIDVYVYGRVS